MQRNIALSGALKLEIVNSRGTAKSLELAFPLFHKPPREMLSFLRNGMQQACRYAILKFHRSNASSACANCLNPRCVGRRAETQIKYRLLRGCAGACASTHNPCA